MKSLAQNLSLAANKPNLVLRSLCEADLQTLLHIESISYSHPWSQNNFLDSLSSHYLMQGLFDSSTRSPKSSMIGYFVAMKGVDELHLLNLTVAPDYHRRGYAKYLLSQLKILSVQQELNWIWLEVRMSNQAAIALYTSYGFIKSGVRKNYYPLGLKGSNDREDALLMSYQVTPCN